MGSYYAVIFTSELNESAAGYEDMAEVMVKAASTQPGFIGIESARGVDGKGITVSYWKTEEDIKNWKANAAHRVAQEKGRAEWYSNFRVRVCKVEREHGK